MDRPDLDECVGGVLMMPQGSPKHLSGANEAPLIRKRRILLVVPYPVFPTAGGGQIRMVGLARGMARAGQRVTVLTPYHPAQKSEALQNEPFELQQVPYFFPMHTLLQGRLLPYHVIASFHPGLKLLVTRIMRDFDVVIFSQVAFASLLACIPDGVQVGYDAQNVEFDYVRHECRHPWIAERVGRRIRRLEQALVERSNHVFSVSSNDRERLMDLYAMPGEKCTLAPNGISKIHPTSDDAAAMEARFPGMASFSRKAIYSGSDVEHNRIAVQYLLEHVAPHAKDVGFVIQGGCGQRFAHQSTLPNVFMDTDHRSFRRYAVAGTIGLNLVVTGSGTNLKLLHYLSHGLPVLSTPFGVRGFSDLESSVLVRERDRFVDALSDGEFPEPVESEYLWDHYSWDRIARDMVETLEVSSPS